MQPLHQAMQPTLFKYSFSTPMRSFSFENCMIFPLHAVMQCTNLSRHPGCCRKVSSTRVFTSSLVFKYVPFGTGNQHITTLLRGVQVWRFDQKGGDGKSLPQILNRCGFILIPLSRETEPLCLTRNNSGKNQGFTLL